MSFREGGSSDQTYDVFLGNLPAETEEQNIKDFFLKYGSIQSVTVREGKRNDGSMIGWVRFYQEDNALNLVQHARENPVTYKGNTLLVNPPRPRRNEDRGGGGGAGDRGRERNSQPKYNRSYTNNNNSSGNSNNNNINNGSFHNNPDILPPHMGGLNLNNRPPPAKEPAQQDCSNPIAEDVMVTHMEDCVTLWVQSIKGEQGHEMYELEAQLLSFCETSQPITSKPTFNMIYATRFSEDGCWYRCKPLLYVDETQTRVQYIDYGNQEVVLDSGIVELNESLRNVNPHAFQLKLRGYQCVDPNPDAPSNKEGVQATQDLLGGNAATAVIYEYHPMLADLLIEGGVDLGQELCKRGFIKEILEKNAMEDQSSLMGNYESAPQHQSMPPGMGMNGHGHRLPPQQPPINMYDACSMDPMTIRKEVEKYRQEADYLRRQNQALADERNKALIEISTVKGQIKTIDDTCMSLRQALASSNLPHKLQELVSGVNMIKLLRMQFPTDDDSEDTIEQAIRLVTDPAEKVTLNSLDIIIKVKASLNIYSTCQEEIKACTDQATLNGFIDARDLARHQLVENLRQFSVIASSLPLDLRAASLRGVIQSLEKNYAFFLNSNMMMESHPLVDILQVFKEWRKKKMPEFSKARTLTNTCNNGVISALRQLQQQLSLDTGNDDNNPGNAANLDALFHKFQAAINREIQRTNLESSFEAPVVTLTLRTLMAELQHELDDITKLRVMCHQYSKMRQHLIPWLKHKPVVTRLVQTRKQLKILKSKLRHTLAAKEDLEESEDSDEEQLKSLSEELATIRERLRAEFEIEDCLLSDLAELNEKHFPELAMQFPDLRITYLVENHGLVKIGRTVEQYDVTPLPNCPKKTIVRANNDKVLKEYIVDEGEGSKKNDFLRRAIAYNKVISPNLIPLEAIFFLKNERQVYIQTPYYNQNLTNIGNETQLSDTEVFMILYGVLQGLHALHEAKLVHGMVHPNNVFVNDSGLGILADYDFSKPEKQRATRHFTTCTRLTFIAPECHGNEEAVTLSSDVYCFGLLILWLYFPKVNLSMKPNHTPDVNGLGLKPCIQNVVSMILNPDPVRRPSTADILDTVYFKQASTFLRSARQQQQGEPPADEETHKEEETLQLRPRQPSPSPSGLSKPGGILKNGSGGKRSPSETSASGPSPIAKEREVVDESSHAAGESFLITPPSSPPTGPPQDQPPPPPQESHQQQTLSLQVSETQDSLTHRSLTQDSPTLGSVTEDSLTQDSLTRDHLTQDYSIHNSLTEDSATLVSLKKDSLDHKPLMQDSLTHNSSTPDSLTQDSLTPSLTEDSLTCGSLTQDLPTHNSLIQDSVNNISLTQESMPYSPLTQDSSTLNSLSQDSAPQDMSYEVMQDLMTQESPTQESLGTDSLPQDFQDPLYVIPLAHDVSIEDSNVQNVIPQDANVNGELEVEGDLNTVAYTVEIEEVEAVSAEHRLGVQCEEEAPIDPFSVPLPEGDVPSPIEKVATPITGSMLKAAIANAALPLQQVAGGTVDANDDLSSADQSMTENSHQKEAMDDDDEFLERIDRMINDYATNRRDRQVSDGDKDGVTVMCDAQAYQNVHGTSAKENGEHVPSPIQATSPDPEQAEQESTSSTPQKVDSSTATCAADTELGETASPLSVLKEEQNPATPSFHPQFAGTLSSAVRKGEISAAPSPAPSSDHQQGESPSVSSNRLQKLLSALYANSPPQDGAK